MGCRAWSFAWVLAISGMLLAVPGWSQPAYLGAWGSEGAGPGEFMGPCSVALSPSGEVCVLDPGNERVQMFTADGGYLMEWPLQAVPLSIRWGAIAVGPTSDVYVMWQGSDQIPPDPEFLLLQKYSAAGLLLGSTRIDAGPSGSGIDAHALAMTSGGDLLVPYTYLDDGGDPQARVARYSAGLTFLGSWGGAAGIHLASLASIWLALRWTSRTMSFCPIKATLASRCSPQGGFLAAVGHEWRRGRAIPSRARSRDRAGRTRVCL